MSSQLRKLLKKDAEYKKFRSILAHADSLAEFDNYVKEIESLHQGRIARQLVYKSISTKRLVKAVLQDASYRARCVEIMVQVNKAQRMLSAALDATKNRIFAKYSAYLSSYRTKGERETYVNAILQSAYKRLADFERIVEMCKYIIEDIDKFSWAARNVIQAMELVYTRENQLGTKTKTV